MGGAKVLKFPSLLTKVSWLQGSSMGEGELMERKHLNMEKRKNEQLRWILKLGSHWLPYDKLSMMLEGLLLGEDTAFSLGARRTTDSLTEDWLSRRHTILEFVLHRKHGICPLYKPANSCWLGKWSLMKCVCVSGVGVMYNVWATCRLSSCDNSWYI